MRAHTITIMSRRRRRARRGAIALVLAVCALAIPASAGAYSSVNAITGGSDDSAEPIDGWSYSLINPPASEPGSPNVPHPDPPPADSGYASLNAITGPTTGEPTVASGSPSSDDQWFDLPSALVGAGSAMALVALGGAAFLTVRRRTEVSPTASTS